MSAAPRARHLRAALLTAALTLTVAAYGGQDVKAPAGDHQVAGKPAIGAAAIAAA